MRLKRLKIKGFRGYQDEVSIPFENLTAFVGKNDAGKSSILDALGVFFEEPNSKIDTGDACIHCSTKQVRITCVFDNLPQELVLDATARTSLAAEGLLNADDDLEIVKVIDCGLAKPKTQVFAVANHPMDSAKGSLLLMKNTELKRLADELGVPRDVSRSNNVALRSGIRDAGGFTPTPAEVPLDKEDAKRVWDQLSQHMPLYAVFRADRASKDSDSEVQEPMATAVDEALADLQGALDEIQKTVRERALHVADRTIEKLRAIDSDIAQGLTPVFSADPKWKGIFKLSINDDDGIPLNKRGSGVRRLMLIAFFQAEAERKRHAAGRTNIIYAVEEPEASQHPENQRRLVQALAELSEESGVQVVITTHVPALAGMLPTAGLRHVISGPTGPPAVELGSDEVLERIADDLGVHPDSRVKVIVCVEGPHDVRCLEYLSSIMHDDDDSLPNLASARDVVVIPLGGSTLKDWVNCHYMAGFGLPEVHIYDRDAIVPPKYQDQADEVNARTDNSIAFITEKRELENYLHEDAIQSALGVSVTVDDTSSIPERVAEAVHAQGSPPVPWPQLSDEKKREKVSRIKRRLNRDAASLMTVEMIRRRGALAEVRNWLEAVAARRH